MASKSASSMSEQQRDERYERWLSRQSALSLFPLIPAATAILLREVKGRLETLLLRRSAELSFVGGKWVFPGGRTDPSDYPYAHTPEEHGGQGAAAGASDYPRTNYARTPSAPSGYPRTASSERRRKTTSETAAAESAPVSVSPQKSPAAGRWGRSYTAAKAAAVRETLEETGLRINPAGLAPYSHWLPPAFVSQQFATWFFLTQAPDGQVRIDCEEIKEAAWLPPAEALERHSRGELAVVPPTYVTLLSLAGFHSIGEAMKHAASREPPFYETALLSLPDGGEVAIWKDDAAFEAALEIQSGSPSGNPQAQAPPELIAAALAASGERHRLWMPGEGPWRCEQTQERG